MVDSALKLRDIGEDDIAHVTLPGVRLRINKGPLVIPASASSAVEFAGAACRGRLLFVTLTVRARARSRSSGRSHRATEPERLRRRASLYPPGRRWPCPHP